MNDRGSIDSSDDREIRLSMTSANIQLPAEVTENETEGSEE